MHKITSLFLQLVLDIQYTQGMIVRYSMFCPPLVSSTAVHEAKVELSPIHKVSITEHLVCDVPSRTTGL